MRVHVRVAVQQIQPEASAVADLSLTLEISFIFQLGLSPFKQWKEAFDKETVSKVYVAFWLFKKRDCLLRSHDQPGDFSEGLIVIEIKLWHTRHNGSAGSPGTWCCLCQSYDKHSEKHFQLF